MKFSLLVITLFLSTILNAQQFGQWENIRNGIKVSSVYIDLSGIETEFILSPNSSLSDDIREAHPNLRTFDLVSKMNPSVKGKLTMDNEAVYIQIKNGGKVTSIDFKSTSPEYNVSITTSKASCGTKDNPSFYGNHHLKPSSTAPQKSADDLNYGSELRTYRLALIGTGEYTAQNGGNAAAALTAATATLNGLNLIYETEASISMTLVASQFYTNENTDPFLPAGDSRVNQAAEAMAMNFANSSYDIGHVFHYTAPGTPWAGGGLAGIGTVCDNGTFFSTSGDSDGLTGPNKGAAWSGSFSNTNNSWLQLTAHEFGHQFDANHSFNGTGSNCSFGISSNNGYEIASGTSIMSYNGLCTAAQNIPSGGEADNYFHASTLDEIANFVNSTSGNCSVNTATGNTPPEAHSNFMSAPIIPIGTPFELTGFGNDADGDALTYQWEQIDEDGPGTPTQGFIGAAAANSTTAPLFRSFPPSESTTRTFPELADILDGNNQNLDFEALPQVSRDINLSFVVRDNAGGVDSDPFQVTSTNTAGPFEVTSQNTASNWIANGSNTTTISWDVANTDNATVNCTEVDILLSTDNGLNFDYIIASNTANDGSHTFQIPNLITTVGRIKIKASNNIFFDINDSFISIESACEANGATFSPSEAFSADQGDASLDLSLSPEYGSIITSFSGTVDTGDLASSLPANNNGSCLNFSGNNTFAEEFVLQVDASGNYTFNKSSGAFGIVMHVYEGDFIPGSPCTNWIGGSFNNNSGQINNSLTVNLTAGIQYTLVVASFSNALPSLPAAYNITYSGAGNAVDGALAPTGFDYYYVVINTTSGNIMDITLDPDLTSFAGGSYEVYGFSVLSSVNTAAYINTPFSTLQSDLLDLTICGNLSSNVLEIDIIGMDCPGDFNNDGEITAGDLTLFLADFGCVVNCIADLNFDGIVTAGDLTLFLAVFGESCN